MKPPLLLSLFILGCATQTSLLDRGRDLATRAFVDSGDFGQANAVLARAVSEAEAAGDERQLARALTWQGFSRYAELMTSGRTEGYEEPRAMVERGLDLRRRLGDEAGLAESLFYSGLLLERMGDHDGALDRYRQSLAIAERLGLEREQSFAVRHIAFIEARRGMLEPALEKQRRSLALREKLGMREYLPYSHLAIGDLLQRLDRRPEALESYERARALADEQNLRRTRVIVALTMGEFFAATDPGRAREEFELAARLAEQIDDVRDLGTARKRLSELK